MKTNNFSFFKYISFSKVKLKIIKLDFIRPFYISLSFLLFSFVGSSQISICDSIFIDSCEINPNNNTEIQLLASNHSVDIISYPGFILFNNNGDTIAKENFNFFGIGWGFQQHVLQIINPPTLPFDGYLELHSNFYDFKVIKYDK